MPIMEREVSGDVVLDKSTISLPLGATIDVGGVAGVFSSLRMENISIKDSCVFVATTPSTPGAYAYDVLRPETVEAIRVAVDMLYADIANIISE